MPLVSLFQSRTAASRSARGRRAWLIAMGIAAAVPLGGALGSAGCHGVCSLGVCFAGLEILVTGVAGGQPPSDPYPLQPAVYRVRAEVDGGTFEVECTFDDPLEGTCEAGDWLAPPARALDPVVSTTGGKGIFEPGISIRFVGHSSARHGSNDYGPDMVDIVVFRDGEEVASASYAPEYELREDFKGEGCGDCETAPSELLFVDPA